jgi:hypothetical protein
VQRCGGEKTKLEKIRQYARPGFREYKMGIKIGNREFSNFAYEEFASVEGLLCLDHTTIVLSLILYGFETW